MTKIKALNCPQCGANIADTSKLCDFCGSKVVLTDDKTRFVLAGIICPHCALENSQGNRFCSNCGDRLLMPCPACAIDMELDTDYCPRCGINVESKLKELIQLQGSAFLSGFMVYRHRCKQMESEIKEIDERLRQKEEIKMLLKKEKLLKRLNYIVYAMIVLLLALSYLIFTRV